MKNYILGIHVGHNASACIGDAEGIRFAAQEERYCREKNYWGFPEQAIRACLAHCGIGPEDVAVVAVGSRFILHRYHSREDVVESYDRQRGGRGYLRQRVAIPLATRLLRDYGQKEVEERLASLGFAKTQVEFHDHHRSHAATAYYGLRKDTEEPTLVLTCDGSGDGLSASVRVWTGTEERLLATTADVDSLGTLYSLTTHAMGFVPLEHEYKLMGMAPYPNPKYAAGASEIFHQYLGLDESGLAFKRKTRAPTYVLLNRILEDIRGRRFDNVCAGLQKFTEDLLVKWVQNAVKATGIGHIVAAGGVFMNVKANKLLAAVEGVKSFQAFPSCGDETLALGTYWLEAARRHGDASVRPLQDFYLGDDLDEEETVAALEAVGFPYDKPEDVTDAVASLLVKGKPVARCAGRMEFGARALCNRSILADPSRPDVVRIINQMVKKRDFWMPFAPVVKHGRQHDYIHNEKELTSPYMMMTFDARENFHEFIAAVHNADLTCRAQLLQENHNPQMHSILESFEEKTGRAVLLNTSFNLHGFPIVRTAREALDVFARSGLEHMQVGDYIVHKVAPDSPTA